MNTARLFDMQEIMQKLPSAKNTKLSLLSPAVRTWVS